MAGCDPSRVFERSKLIEFCDAIVYGLLVLTPIGKAVSQPCCLEQTCLIICLQVSVITGRDVWKEGLGGDQS